MLLPLLFQSVLWYSKRHLSISEVVVTRLLSIETYTHRTHVGLK